MASLIGSYSLSFGLFLSVFIIFFSVRNLRDTEILDKKIISFTFTQFFFVVLSFFGLIMKLGPIAEWGLNMDKKTIEVNPENFETSKKGIFAAGDICSYPGKLKLILSGFHEVALASVECFKRARPNEKYRFEFTTSSRTIQDRLGKK